MFCLVSCTIFILYFLNTSAFFENNNIVLNENCNSTSIIEKAVFLAATNYKRHFVTTIVWKDQDTNDIASFLNNYKGTIALFPILKNKDFSNIVKKFNKKAGFDQTVIFATDVDEFEHFAEVINETVNKTIKVILVVTRKTGENELRNITSVAWSNNMADIFIISSEKSSNIQVSTYFPYNGKNCEDLTPVILNTTNIIFMNKFSNFHRCPIRVLLLSLLPYINYKIENNTINLYGVDSKIVLDIFDKMNASKKVVLNNKTLDSLHKIGGYAVAELFANKADFAVPNVLLSHTRYQLADPVHMYKTINIAWIGPELQPVSSFWDKIVLPFMNVSTVLLLTSITSLVIAISMTKKIKLPKEERMKSVLFQSVIALFEQELKFVTKSGLVNSLYILLIWFCLIIRIAYQAKLVDVMQKVTLEKPFKSFEEAVDILDDYYGSEYLHQYYKHTAYYSRYRVVDASEFDRILKNITQGQRSMLLVDKNTAFLSNPNLPSIGKVVAQHPYCLMTRRGWPAAKAFNRGVLALIETGHIQKVLTDQFKLATRKKKTYVDRAAHPLSMSKLIGLLHCLTTTYAVLVFVFIGEILYFKMFHK